MSNIPTVPPAPDFNTPAPAPIAIPAPPVAPAPAPAPMAAPQPAGVPQLLQAPKSQSSLVPKEAITTEEIKGREQIAREIKAGKAEQGFNARFTRFILNTPPNEDDVKVDRVPGRKGETQHIPLNIMQLMADEIFEGGWGVVSGKFTKSIKKGKNGPDMPFTICEITIEVFYPLTNLRRTFFGASDSNMAQQTASEALLSFALKNALGKIGKRFGNRYLYAKIDRGYEEEIDIPTSASVADMVGAVPVTPPPAIPPTNPA